MKARRSTRFARDYNKAPKEIQATRDKQVQQLLHDLRYIRSSLVQAPSVPAAAGVSITITRWIKLQTFLNAASDGGSVRADARP